jgi:anaerobic dimethyl sulfoxide reductase subunit A
MGEVKIIHTTGVNNCGGRCIINAHVQDGKIFKMTTDNPHREDDAVPLCACARGMNYHKTFLGEDRLKHPMKRVGERGEGRFERISWEEAVGIISREWIRIRDTYGPGSRYVNYSTGVISLMRPDHLAKRLLALDGGYLDYYNSYSTACVRYATPYIYGTNMTGNGFEGWLNSKLIILWGHNPSETVFDTGTMHYLRLAKKKGIPIIGVDPRKNDTILRLDAEWIPLKPTTDSAMMDGMAYVIKSENLYDKEFIDRCCIGFDKEHMPEGVDPAQCYFSYLDGEQDGIPKTPAWASGICGVPEDTIVRLARLYATTKPAALIQGYGPQRHGNGEQATRGGIMLACLTGNVGVSGGWACGPGGYERHKIPKFPNGENPYTVMIPCFLWTDAVERGRELTGLDGVTGGAKLESDVKMILNLAGNTLVNQHGDINRTIEILKDTTKCEFILCSDLFMTASAKFADILLPGTSMFEGENISMPWVSGDFLGFNNKAVEPLYESRFEYDWLKEVAENLGIKEAFTNGHETVGGWLRDLYGSLRKEETELPEYEVFKSEGMYRYRKNPPVIALEQECRDPEKHPFPTPSGRIEIFSKRIYETEYRDYVAPTPKYVPSFEGPEDMLIEKYPLQLIGWHTKRRCHSIHDSNLGMHKMDPQALWMNVEDAVARGIHDDSMVRIWNDRGTVHLKVKITDRIMKGVVAMSEGAWYKPDSDGNDTGGSANVLTSQKPSPFAKGNAQHTSLVQVEMFEELSKMPHVQKSGKEGHN